MTGTRQHDDGIALMSEESEDPRAREARRAWVDVYGLPLAQRLEVDRRYSLVTVGAAQYAFTTYDAYTRAMGHIWSAGLVPEPLPTTRGADLPAVAPHLWDVDPDLGDLTAADVDRPRRFR